MKSAVVLRNTAMAVLGLTTGGVFLWLALRNIDFDELRTMVVALDGSVMMFAAALYWLALMLRVLRWRVLLRELGAAPLLTVTETLVVGYAVNNVVPARLGEVVRAAYAKRRLRIGRARVFGSIVIERALDLAAILVCLGGGLLMLRVIDDASRMPTFELIALNAGAVIGVVLLGIVAVRSGDLGNLANLRLPDTLVTVFDDFRRGLATLNRRSSALSVVLTSGIWFFETCAVAQTFAAFGVGLDASQALLIMGAASLSTLVPTAPGYLGTYQLVFVLAMTAFGFSATAGIAASTAIQVVLFGSVTLAGAAILGARSIKHLALLSGALPARSSKLG